MTRPFRKGDTVRIRPQYQDEGDENFVWIVMSDEEKGRVDISPLGTGMNLVPLQTVRTDSIQLASSG